MQAIEKIDISSNWVTLIFMLLLLCVFFLKGFKSIKLKEYFLAFFNKGFITSELEERTSFFNRFSFFLLLFTVIIFALLSFFLINFFTDNTFFKFFYFTKIVAITFFYFFVKWVLEYLLVSLFSIQNVLISFLTAKKIYSYTLSLWFFPLLIFYQYTVVNKKIILILICLLFCVKFLLLFVNNKKLILNKLFYFILYICAFEIAPLFILFKLMF